MILVIGGVCQGKTEYVRANFPDRTIFDDFEEWFRRAMKEGEKPEDEVEKYMKEYPDAVIISDEVGCGIVPMEAFEREYRERLGRCLTKIAAGSERVIRLYCGIATVIK
ncbi:MAG: bifunctional adenosylcobinamide kinase/adenosylcobinamide-phosphate guanylyltransferase [Lachnospiraceae bacterium]|nr:bifunctional adenosylcobinamide kinase/adenosylcobinamide-phosphate guanylyltransferase [Lachnospiraceae bacterium]